MLRQAAVLGVCVFGVAYSVLAAQYMFGVQTGNVWYEEIEAVLVGNKTYGDLLRRTQHANYSSREFLKGMRMHTIFGGAALCLQFVQIYGKLGAVKSLNAWHRQLGWLIVVCVLAQLTGVLPFLSQAPTYGGEYATTFFIVLSVLWLFTLLSALVLFYYGRYLNKEVHVFVSVFNHALLWSAPVLRVSWVVLGRYAAPLSKEAVNVIGSALTATALTFLAIWYSIRRRERVSLSRDADYEPLMAHADRLSTFSLIVYVALLFGSACFFFAFPTDPVVALMREPTADVAITWYIWSAIASMLCSLMVLQQGSARTLGLFGVLTALLPVLTSAHWFFTSPSLATAQLSGLPSVVALNNSVMAFCVSLMRWRACNDPRLSRRSVREWTWISCGFGSAPFLALLFSILISLVAPGEMFDRRNHAATAVAHAGSLCLFVPFIAILSNLLATPKQKAS